ncbi:MAG: TatD family deoxyribonuclease, partial [Ferruginibacter sp.]|nr:TatD family deoxyribonuclease [Ferruginibacter sp.]
MTDTHCHLYLDDFKSDIEQVISRARSAGVEKMYLPAIDSSTHDAMIALEENYSGICHAMMGLHPCYVKENYLQELDIVEGWLRKRKFVAIGEVGLDFYWDKTYVKEQYFALEKQIEWAIEYRLPLILHTRKATEETIQVIKRYYGKGLTGIFHCFGGSLEQAQQIIELGFYLGIGGVVTYKNAGLAEVVKDIDLSKIVLETDAPYLSPVPYRGKRNESAYIEEVAVKIASIKQMDVDEVIGIT